MDLFNRKKLKELDDEVIRLTMALSDSREEICRLEAKLAEYQHDDATPWFQVNSDGCDANRGVKIAMDWNDAFITYLEELGVNGPTAEAAVQRWMAMVNIHLIDQLEAAAIENDDRGTVPDVVKDY